MMDRRQQIIESFAGPFAQLVLAGIASIIAWSFPAWILSETMYKFAVLNYLVVIMNLIPLLELDGYYILADLIEVPDLREIARVHAPRPLPQAEGARAFLQAGRGLSSLRGVGRRVHDLLPVHGVLLLEDGVRRSREPAVGRGPRHGLLLLILAVFIAGRCSVG